METQICNHCLKEKSIASFHKNQLGANGMASYCKDCKKMVRGKYEGHPQCPKCKYHRRLDKNGVCWHCNAEGGLRQCNYCGDLLPSLLSFSPKKNERYPGQYQRQCKMCTNGKRFGLPRGMYSKMFEAQEGRCAICGDKSKKLLGVDHNHTNNTIRSLLCHRCNVLLGLARENPEILTTAIEYLNFWNTYDYNAFTDPIESAKENLKHLM